MCDACNRLVLQVERLTRLINGGGHGRVSIAEAEAYLNELKHQLNVLKGCHDAPAAAVTE